MSALTKADDEQWTEDKCLDLIAAYEQRRILWDTHHPQFKSRYLKINAWREIGEEMETNPSACKHKMGVLLSSFRREKAKLNFGEYVSNWFAFEALAFLLIKTTSGARYTPKRRISKKPPASANSSQTPAIKSKDDVVPTSLSASQVNDLLQPVYDEELKYFSTFIATKMKQYSVGTKNAVQQAICDIIFKADAGFYEMQTSVTQTVTQTDTLQNKTVETVTAETETVATETAYTAPFQIKYDEDMDIIEIKNEESDTDCE